MECPSLQIAAVLTRQWVCEVNLMTHKARDWAVCVNFVGVEWIKKRRIDRGASRAFAPSSREKVVRHLPRLFLKSTT